MLKRTLYIISFSMMLLIFPSCQVETKPATENNSQEKSIQTKNSTKSQSETKNHPDEAKTKLALPKEDLKKGDRGPEIEKLQQILNEIGYPIEINGIYDEDTTWAITDLQLHEQLLTTGMYCTETKHAINDILKNEQTIKQGKHLARPTHEDLARVENPYDILALVNKNRALPEDYEPADLTVPDVRFPFTEDLPKKYLRKVAADALEELFVAAEQDNIILFAQSGYRSYERQEAIFTSNINAHGEEKANTFSAKPGNSEHQTGLVMDVTSESVDFLLEEEFGDTPEGQWVSENAHKFGFVIRYPEGKENITGYVYEPWHLRYLGKEVAKELYESGLTLEEYLAKKELWEMD